MPLLLRDNASTNSFGRTRRKSTSRGTLTPCRAPMLLDPAAPAVVDVGGNHPDGQPRDARDLHRPDSRGELFDKVRRRPAVRPPCCNDRPTTLELSRHISSLYPCLVNEVRLTRGGASDLD